MSLVVEKSIVAIWLCNLAREYYGEATVSATVAKDNPRATSTVDA